MATVNVYVWKAILLPVLIFTALFQDSDAVNFVVADDFNCQTGSRFYDCQGRIQEFWKGGDKGAKPRTERRRPERRRGVWGPSQKILKN